MFLLFFFFFSPPPPPPLPPPLSSPSPVLTFFSSLHLTSVIQLLLLLIAFLVLFSALEQTHCVVVVCFHFCDCRSIQSSRSAGESYSRCRHGPVFFFQLTFCLPVTSVDKVSYFSLTVNCLSAVLKVSLLVQINCQIVCFVFS